MAESKAMIRYGQYCPIAKALEVLAERWTLLIVRELLMGSRRFNDLRRGVPLMAPSMMSRRLRTLVATGIIVRERVAPGDSPVYRLTEAGHELRPLIMQLGTWGQRWSRSRMQADDLDASFLMWDIRRNVHTDKLPRQRIIVYFEFPDAKKGMKDWWLVIEEGDVDLCLEDPGHDVDIAIVTSLRTMTQIWMGDLSFAVARAKGLLKVTGAPAVTRNVSEWLGASPFANVAPAAAREIALT
jgi:DNA-binding HxlR family transcriptional regulator